MPVRPADGGALLGGQRLGHQRVVPDRHDVRTTAGAAAAGRRWCRARPGARVTRPYGVRSTTPAPDARRAPVDRRVLVDPDAEPQAGRAQAPGQPGRVDHRARRRRSSTPAEVGRRVDLGAHLRRRPATPAGCRRCAPSAGQLAQVVDLPRRGRDGRARRCARRRSRCRARPRPPRCRRGSPGRAARRVGQLVGEAVQAVAQPVGEAGRAEPAVAAGRRPADGAALEQHDVPVRVALLGQQRGPQPGVAAADDGEVGRVAAPASAGHGVGPAGPSSQYGACRTSTRAAAAVRRPAGVTIRPSAASGRPVTAWPTSTAISGDEEHGRADHVGLRRDAALRRTPRRTSGRCSPSPELKLVMMKSSKDSANASSAPASDARRDQRQGDPPEGLQLVGVEVHRRLLEPRVQARDPRLHGDHDEADAEHDVRDDDRPEARGCIRRLRNSASSEAPSTTSGVAIGRKISRLVAARPRNRCRASANAIIVPRTVAIERGEQRRSSGCCRARCRRPGRRTGSSSCRG